MTALLARPARQWRGHLTVAVCVLMACDSTGPSPVFGTYQLTACVPDTTSLAVPCSFPDGNPGDSFRMDGSSLVLSSDSTFTLSQQYQRFQGGTWQPPVNDTLVGTYADYPVNPNVVTIAMTFIPSPSGSQAYAEITGRQLTYGGRWIYRRQ